jgi:AraC-like DNA-binding protein
VINHTRAGRNVSRSAARRVSTEAGPLLPDSLLCSTPTRLIGEEFQLTEIVHYSLFCGTAPPHGHPVGDIVAVFEGTAREEGLEDLCEGDIRVDRGNEPSFLSLSSSARVVVVELSGTRREELRRTRRGESDPVVLPLEAFEGLAGRLEGELRCRDRGAAMALSGLLVELVGGISRELAAGKPRILPPWLRAAVRIVESRWAEPLELGDVANAVGVPAPRVAREFRRLRGCSVGEWLRRRRLRAAIRPIAGSADPLSAIARRSGFHDASHLSREFRKAWGMTPGAFRQDHRKLEGPQ